MTRLRHLTSCAARKQQPEFTAIFYAGPEISPRLRMTLGRHRANKEGLLERSDNQMITRRRYRYRSLSYYPTSNVVRHVAVQMGLCWRGSSRRRVMGVV